MGVKVAKTFSLTLDIERTFEVFKWRKMRTKGVPFGYLEFSCAFWGKPSPRIRARCKSQSSESKVWVWVWPLPEFATVRQNRYNDSNRNRRNHSCCTPTTSPINITLLSVKCKQKKSEEFSLLSSSSLQNSLWNKICYRVHHSLTSFPYSEQIFSLKFVFVQLC